MRKSRVINPKIELVAIESLEAASYNPREAEDWKLELLRLSLLKFGFLSPIYATPQGEILSGHQRHFLAQEIGLKKVPVCFLSKVTEENKKNVNICFNRATNDFLQHENTKSVSEKLKPEEIKGELSCLPDLELEQISKRAIKYELMDTGELERNNAGNLSHHRNTANVSLFLFKIGAFLPIIIDEDEKIINGKERFKGVIRKQFSKYPIIRVKTEHAGALHSLFNHLTMSFTLHRQYRDMLRHNSFRRRLNENRYKVSLALVFGIGRTMRSKDLDLANQSIREKFERVYGDTILDFGAGQLRDCRYLKEHGFRCIPFEPYYAVGNNIDKPSSIKIVQDFLSALHSGTNFSAITLGAVFNSIPFMEDCKHVLTILAALSLRNQAPVYTVTRSVADGLYRKRNGYRKDSSFFLDYEDENFVSVGGYASKPKTQRYFTSKSFYEFFKPYFSTVCSYLHNGVVRAMAKGAKQVSMEQLNEALEFEFDLPYPDGSRMGLVKEAKQAFYFYLRV